jgi:hypothetical protein
MFYEEIEQLPKETLKRLGVKKEVLILMLEVIENYKSTRRKQLTRVTPAKLSNADELLLMLM